MNKKSRRKTKSNKTKSNKTKSNKTKSRKGGFLNTMSLGINGINISRQTGKKRYNWKTGKLDDVTCYGIGSLKWCKHPE